MVAKLYIPKYVSKNMKLSERLKIFIMKRRAKRAVHKMEQAIERGNHDKACQYEDLMYQTDDALTDFIKALSIKYVSS